MSYIFETGRDWVPSGAAHDSYMVAGARLGFLMLGKTCSLYSGIVYHQWLLSTKIEACLSQTNFIHTFLVLERYFSLIPFPGRQSVFFLTTLRACLNIAHKVIVGHGSALSVKWWWNSTELFLLSLSIPLPLLYKNAYCSPIVPTFS